MKTLQEKFTVLHPQLSIKDYIDGEVDQVLFENIGKDPFTEKELINAVLDRLNYDIKMFISDELDFNKDAIENLMKELTIDIAEVEDIIKKAIEENINKCSINVTSVGDVLRYSYCE